jgi:hypothetical protein
MKSKNNKTDSDLMRNLEPFSKALGKAAGQVWKIFVMRYVAKGVSEVFMAFVVSFVSYKSLNAHHSLWMLMPYIVSTILIYDAIQLLINPFYFAMNDVALRLKQENIFKK